jgi:hypothetical protein
MNRRRLRRQAVPDFRDAASSCMYIRPRDRSVGDMQSLPVFIMVDGLSCGPDRGIKDVVHNHNMLRTGIHLSVSSIPHVACST